MRVGAASARVTSVSAMVCVSLESLEPVKQAHDSSTSWADEFP